MLIYSKLLSFFAGIGGASKEGVLIKGSNYMETLSKAKYVVFDKTGTLTQGVFEVSAVHHNEMEEKKLLEYAALAECASSHPISKSLQKAYGKEIDRSRVYDIKEISGYGIIAKVDGNEVAAGNSKLMKKIGVEYHDCHRVGTIIHMAINGKYAGHIVISDILKPHSKEVIAELKKAGVEKTVMLTGDAKRVADQVAQSLGIDEVYSELLPADKVSKVEELLSTKAEKDKLAFVGDGINDAPVLTRADIGIAMGAMGSDAAIEAADVVLMDDDPLKISKAIKISRKCLRIVYQNIIFALVARRFVEEQLVARGMIADLAIHDPKKGKDKIPNPHMHIMVPIRPLQEDGTWGQKQKKVPVLTPDGQPVLNQKGQPVFRAVHTTDWSRKETLEELRSAWARMCNELYEEKGLTERVDARSYEERGIDKISMVHEGSNVQAMEARGISTALGSLNRLIRALNDMKERAKNLLQWSLLRQSQLMERIEYLRRCYKRD